MLALAVWPASAQDEHDRELAAELLVLRGDLRRLADPATPPQRRRGLAARLDGALSSLPLLLRLAGESADAVPEVRKALAAGELASAAAMLDELVRRRPLDIAGILPADPALAARGRTIHEEACAGCHAAPDPDAELPALDLAGEAGSMPPEEFAARLVNGLRGDHLTALANPFPDRDLSALMAHYAEGAPLSLAPPTAARSTP